LPNKAILFRPQDDFMVHEKIVQAIDTNQRPLNRTGLTCVPDDDEPQAFAWPAVLQQFKPGSYVHASWIVGLYDGGAQFHCGIFHPCGICLMRQLQVRRSSKRKRGYLYRICPVCRYILVDKLDPSLHGQIDQLYAEIYPEVVP
jgi:hypothetical protein